MDAVNNNSGQCIDGTSNPEAAVKFFEKKITHVLNNPECQTSCTSAEPVIDRSLRIKFSLSEVDVNLQSLKDSPGWDGIHTNHLKYSEQVFLSF